MQLSRRKALGTPVLRITGDVDHDDAPALERAAWEAFGSTGTRIILDLKDCSHIGSTGLAVLFSLVRWAQAKEGSVTAVCSDPALLRLFRLVHLTGEEGFQVFPDINSVLEARRTDGGRATS